MEGWKGADGGKSSGKTRLQGKIVQKGLFRAGRALQFFFTYAISTALNIKNTVMAEVATIKGCKLKTLINNWQGCKIFVFCHAVCNREVLIPEVKASYPQAAKFSKVLYVCISF